MRKSRLADICIYTVLGIIVLNVFIFIMMLNTPYTFIKIMSWISKPLMILSVVTFVTSMISLVRILSSRKQLKGLAKSIIALILSVIVFIGIFIQGLFAEAIISVDKVFIH